MPLQDCLIASSTRLCVVDRPLLMQLPELSRGLPRLGVGVGWLVGSSVVVVVAAGQYTSSSTSVSSNGSFKPPGRLGNIHGLASQNSTVSGMKRKGKIQQQEQACCRIPPQQHAGASIPAVAWVYLVLVNLVATETWPSEKQILYCPVDLHTAQKANALSRKASAKMQLLWQRCLEQEDLAEV